MLTSNLYTPLTAGEILPAGWLLTQLKTEASGLSGNLDKIWPDVRDSRWIGGSCDGWERVPYWLDGFVPLAYLLRDDDMMKRAKRYIDAILAGQCEDGWLCPCSDEDRAGYDMWALLLISKVLVLYADCEPSYADRIETVLMKAFRQADGHLREHPLFNWGKYRWFEGLVAVYWLYERTKDEWLLSFADLLHEQGKDYTALIDREFDAYKIPEKKWQWDTHVVNLAMAIKSEGFWQKRMGASNADCGVFPRHMYETLMQYHGMANGHFTGDECLDGRAPIQGTELCGVVEAMYSYEQLLALTGDTYFGDLLEKVTFNALPATTSTDMWTHQYDQQINQIACAPESEHVIFGSNGREANSFGLEPNYGCCTANMPQGWPKLALAVFMKNENAIFSALPLAAEAKITMHGVPVSVRCESAYPFRDSYSYMVKTDAPVEFSLDLRIPGTAKTASVNGEAVKPGSVHHILKTWEGETVITVSLTFDICVESAGYGELQCVRRGALLYALPVKATRIMKEYEANGVIRKFPYCDYHLYPAENWEYGFAGVKELSFAENSFDETSPVFSEDRPPVVIRTPLAPINWGKEPGFAWVCAAEPKETVPVGEPRMMTLIPYGCTDLRMTAMPVLK